MLLTGHKSRAIFDRYNIINEQELLDAGDQLVEYLAQQAQAVPARQRPHTANAAAPRTAFTPPPRATRHRVKAHGPRAPARGRGRQWPDTARLCAAAHARATDTNRPAIVAHTATGQADAAEHEHTPGPAAGASRKAGCHSPAQGQTRQRGVASRSPPAASCPAGELPGTRMGSTRDVLQLSKRGRRAMGRVEQAPSHATIPNSLLMN